jgi:hypothetical protein
LMRCQSSNGDRYRLARLVASIEVGRYATAKVIAASPWAR